MSASSETPFRVIVEPATPEEADRLFEDWKSESGESMATPPELIVVDWIRGEDGATLKRYRLILR